MATDATLKLSLRPPAGGSQDQGESSDSFDFVIVKTLDKTTTKLFSDEADNGLLLPAVGDNAEAAITDGTSNTLMVGERMPMTPADAWTLEALARAWVTPLR